jgi:hypothetical protein
MPKRCSAVANGLVCEVAKALQPGGQGSPVATEEFDARWPVGCQALGCLLTVFFALFYSNGAAA